MAASDYVPTFFKKPLALGGASTDEYTPNFGQYQLCGRNHIAIRAFSFSFGGMGRPVFLSQSGSPAAIRGWVRTRGFTLL